MLCKWSLIEIGEIVDFHPFDDTYVTLYLKDTWFKMLIGTNTDIYLLLDRLIWVS